MNTTNNKNIPVIFDTDPGIDDAMALIFLNACKRLELKGITTVFGNASIEQCTNNALYLCERFNMDVPVYAGAGMTIAGSSNTEYPTFVHGEYGLGDLDAAPISRRQESEAAVNFLLDTAEKHAGELTIIAVGRMTNLANAIQASTEFSQNVKEVIIMGGAVNVPGNVTQWAEANIIGDPEAAAILFESGIPVTQIGLDVTMKTVMREDYIQNLAGKCGDAGVLLSQITPYYLNFYRSRTGENGFACHDSSAVAHAEDPDIHKSISGTLSVVLDGEERGRTLFTQDELIQNPLSQEKPGIHSLCSEVDAPGLLKMYDEYLVKAYA
jgi:purine nucleosidase